jgi:hypothetical protein
MAMIYSIAPRSPATLFARCCCGIGWLLVGRQQKTKRLRHMRKLPG